MKKTIRTIVLLVASSLIFAACSSSDDEGGVNSNNPPTSGQTTSAPDGGASTSTPDVGPQLSDDAITLTVVDKVYDGQAISVTASATSGRTPVITYSVQNESSEPFSAAPKNAGSYVVHASLEADATYKAASSNKNFVISQKEVGLVWGAPENLVYNEEAKVPSVIASGVVAGDTVNVASALKSGEDNVHAGSFHYEATSLDNVNYKLPENKVSPAYTISKANYPAQIVHLGDILFRSGLDLTGEEFTLPQGYEWDLDDELDNYQFNSLGKRSYPVIRTGDADHNDTHTTADFTIVRGDPRLEPGYQVPHLAAYYGDPLSTAASMFTPLEEAQWHFEDDPDSPIQKISVGDNHPTYKMTYNCGDPRYQVIEHIEVPCIVAKSDDNVTGFGAASKVYDGEPFEPIAPTLNEDAEVTYEYYLQSDVDQENPLGSAPVNVGDYTVVAETGETDHYNTDAVGADFSILKAVGEISFKSNFEKVYANHSAYWTLDERDYINYNGTIDSINVTVRYSTDIDFTSWNSGKPDHEGVFYVEVTGKDPNFTECKVVEQIVLGATKSTYDKQLLSWSNRNNFNKSYDGVTSGTPTLSYNGDAIDGSIITTEFKLESASDWTAYTDQVLNAGTYNFRFILAETESYHSGLFYFNTEITKVDPSTHQAISDYELPSFSGVHYGQTLHDLCDSGHDYATTTAGKWFFEEELDTYVGNAGERTHLMHYEPDDSVNFLQVGPLNININIAKATALQGRPTNLEYPISTKLSNIPLPPEYTWVNPNAYTYNGAIGWHSYDAKCNPSDNIDCAANTSVQISVYGTKGSRFGSLYSKWQNGEWTAPINIVYDGEPITYKVDYNGGHSSDGMTNYDLSLAYGPFQQAPYLVEFKQAGESDINYTTLAPSEPGNYVVRLTVDENEMYLGVVYEGQFSIVYREPDFRYVDYVSNKTYQIYVEGHNDNQAWGRVDVFNYSDKSVEQLREYNPDEVLAMYEFAQYDSFLDTRLLTCVDTTEYKPQIQFTAEYVIDKYVLTPVGEMSVQYVSEYPSTDTSGSEPVEMMQTYLFFTVDGLKYDHLCGYGFNGKLEDYDPTDLSINGLDTDFLWYEEEGYIFTHAVGSSWLYIYEIGQNNFVTYFDPSDHIGEDYVYRPTAFLGILFEINGQLYVSFTDGESDPSAMDTYDYYYTCPCGFYEVQEDEDTLNVFHYFVAEDGHYYWIINDHQMTAQYEIDEYTDYSVVNTNGFVFYQMTYPAHIEAKIWIEDHDEYFESATYDEESKTWTCVYEMYDGSKWNMMFQIDPENDAQVYQVFGNLVVSGYTIWIDKVNPDDPNTWVEYKTYLYVYDSGTIVSFANEAPENPATDPYTYFDFGTYDEETHILTMYGDQYLYENGVFTYIES